METVTSVDGTRIGYTKSGTGPPLLLVHGTTADHSRWTPLLPAFERHFTVYAMDRRGRGGSGDGPDYALMREAEDVAAVIDVAGEPVAVLGHSFGALCSLEAALLTSNVRRLVLYEPPIDLGVRLYPQEILDRIQALVDSGDKEAATEVMFREGLGMPDHEFEVYRRLPVWRVRVSLAHTIAREGRYDHDYPFRPERFADLQVPTLLLLGGDSADPMRKGTAAVHAALPNSRVVTLPGQQHVAMDTAPELFVGEVLRLLRA